MKAGLIYLLLFSVCIFKSEVNATPDTLWAPGQVIARLNSSAAAMAHVYLQTTDSLAKDSCLNILDGYLDNIGVWKLKMVHYFDPEADTIYLPEEAFNSFVVYYTDTLDSVMGVVNLLSENNYVDFVHPNYNIDFFYIVPDDPKWSDYDNVNNVELGQLTYMWAMMMPYAWEIQKGCTDIRVAIIDDGFRDLDHPDMDGKYSSTRRYDAYDGDYDPTGNNSFHGHQISSVVAAEPDNNEGIAGMVWNSEIVPIRVVNYADNARAIDWVVQHNHAKIINMSFGYWNPVSQFPDMELSMKVGTDNGHIFIAAAGKYGTVLPYPCTSQYTISVGGLRRNLDRDGSVSCYGDSLDIMAFSELVWTCWRSTINQYKIDNGTSFAAPMVAGVAALLSSQNPYLNFYEVRNVLTRGAIKVNQMGTSNFNEYFGYGLVDAHRALKMAPVIEPNIVLSNETVYDIKYVHAQNTIDAGSDFNVMDSAYVEFKAGSQIALTPGFSAAPITGFSQYAEFNAQIRNIGNPCSNNGIRSGNFDLNVDTLIYTEFLDNFISIHPNPTNGEFVINGHDVFKDNFKIECIDYLGKKIDFNEKSGLIKKLEDSKLMVDFSHLPTGIYIITIQTYSNQVFFNKLIVH